MVHKYGKIENIHYDKFYFYMRKVWREKLWLNQDEKCINIDSQKPMSLNNVILQRDQPFSKSGVEKYCMDSTQNDGIKLKQVRVKNILG